MLINSDYFTAQDRRDNWQDHYNIVTVLKSRYLEATVANIHKHFARAKARIIAIIKTNYPTLDDML